jgi:hypothetical protein
MIEQFMIACLVKLLDIDSRATPDVRRLVNRALCDYYQVPFICRDIYSGRLVF